MIVRLAADRLATAEPTSLPLSRPAVSNKTARRQRVERRRNVRDILTSVVAPSMRSNRTKV